MKSQEIAQIFREIALILELKGSNPFRIRAYERGAQNIENLGDELESLSKKGELRSLPGIGADLAAKITEYLTEGEIEYYVELKAQTPQGLLDMLDISGLGPKTVKLIYDKLGIDNIDSLEEAAKNGGLETLEGIRVKTQENILKGIELLRKTSQRTPFYLASDMADDFIGELKKIKDVKKIEIAGSLRRKKETVKDIDILVAAKKSETIMDKFTKLEFVDRVVAKGKTKSSIITRTNNIGVDLRVVTEESFPAALLYFTGSKGFNIKLRQLANKLGFKINEYGVFSNDDKNKLIATSREKNIFSLLKLQFIPPELREDRGEIKSALDNNLPKLIELKDIKGDLHLHSDFSDGEDQISDMAKAAGKLGLEYIAVTDHSRSLKIANGLSTSRMHEKIKQLRQVDRKLKSIKILAGSEVDILNSGELDYPDSILAELDFVIAAIHSGFKQSKEQLTRRIVKACKNKFVNAIAHPTGILWGVRDSYSLDFDEILKVAFDYNVALEINSHPQRLDLNDSLAFRAKSEGVKIVINSDAHRREQLELMKYGVNIARRAWLQKSDVINCFTLNDLLKWLKK